MIFLIFWFLIFDFLIFDFLIFDFWFFDFWFFDFLIFLVFWFFDFWFLVFWFFEFWFFDFVVVLKNSLKNIQHQHNCLKCFPFTLKLKVKILRVFTQFVPEIVKNWKVKKKKNRRARNEREQTCTITRLHHSKGELIHPPLPCPPYYHNSHGKYRP